MHAGRIILTTLAAVALLFTPISGAEKEAKKEHGPPLPGTKPLTMEGDIASQLVAGVDKFLLREIDKSVERRAKHGQYGKYLTEKKKYKCHDEHQSAKPGDKVRIVETRPMSREKRWRVAEVLVKAEAEMQGKAEV